MSVEMAMYRAVQMARAWYDSGRGSVIEGAKDAAQAHGVPYRTVLELASNAIEACRQARNRSVVFDSGEGIEAEIARWRDQRSRQHTTIHGAVAANHARRTTR